MLSLKESNQNVTANRGATRIILHHASTSARKLMLVRLRSWNQCNYIFPPSDSFVWYLHFG